MKKFIYYFIVAWLFVSVPYSLISAQPKQDTSLITGTVIDEHGSPVIGATVVVTGTSSGATTDTRGRFTIKGVNAGTLQVRFIGYQTAEVNIQPKKTHYDITLQEEIRSVDEVVVIGYSAVPRKDLTGSVAAMRSDELMKTGSTDFTSALQGRMAGVRVTTQSGEAGAGVDITIRGTNSLNAGTAPLYVIDGMQIDVNQGEVATSSAGGGQNTYNPLASINPNDIASIDVLKDASAAAIYGARGANGVIIIETKKGKVGRAVVSYTGTFGVQSVTKKIDMMSSYDYVNYMIERDESNYATFLTNEGRTLDDYRNIRAIDWQDKIFRTAFVHMHNVSLRGGNKMTRYAASASLSNQPGVIVNSGYKKYQGRLSLDQQISKAVKLSLNANYTQDKISGQTSSSALSTSNSYATYLMYRTWAFRPVMLSHQSTDDLFDDDFDGSNSAVMNPYITTMNENRHQKRTTFMANAKLGITLAKGLTLNISGGYTSYNSRTTEFNNSESYKGYPRPNNSKNVNASVADYLRNDWMNENVLTYKRKYNNKHNFDVMVGFTMQGTTTEKYGFETTNIPDEGLGLSGMDDGLPYATNVSLSENTLMSALARVNYNYKSRYMFTASFRADGSSKFMDGHRWGYFPSGAFAWRMGEEPWLRMAGWINEAKLRVSVGMTGNNRVGDFSAYPSISMSDYYSIGNATPGEAYIPNNLGNRDLTWETTTQYNIGYDLSLFRSRLNFTVDLYRKNTTDLLLNANMPYSSGYTKVFKNVGAVRNQGIELSLSTVNIQTKDFTWSSDFNISFNRSKVMELTEGEEFLLSKVSFTADYNSSYLYIAQVGQPMAQFYGYEWAGVYGLDDFDCDSSGNYTLKKGVPTNGEERDKIQPGDIKYVDQNNDGVVNDKDRVVIGRGEPIHTGGFNNNFTYKGLTLNVFFQWNYGNDIMNANRIIFEGNALSKNINQYASYADRWSPENQTSRNFRTNGQGPSGVYSSRTIEDGSFLRLKTLQLSYKLPRNWIRKLHIASCEIFVSGQNLFTWTDYSGLDPEVSTRYTALTPGFDYSAYARNRIFTGGIKLIF